MTNSDRPLPKSQWWIGTGNIRTAEQWEEHLRKGRKLYGTVLWLFPTLGFIAALMWPAPGFGEGIGITLLLFAVLTSPWYLLYHKYYYDYFGGGWATPKTRPTPTPQPVTKTYVDRGNQLERTQVAQQDFEGKTHGRY